MFFYISSSIFSCSFLRAFSFNSYSALIAASSIKASGDAASPQRWHAVGPA
jgi:hypothetical protein